MYVACVNIQHLPIQCEVSRSPELRSRIILIYHGEESRPLVLDASPRTRIRRGTSLGRAMSQIPEATVVRADEDFYDASWQRVINRLLNISDRVEDANRGNAFVAIDGLSQLYGSQDQTLNLISKAVAEQGFGSRIGAAPGRFPAYCAAIRAQPSKPVRLLDSRTEVMKFLDPMPVDLLPLESQVIELMHDFTLHTMGDVAAQSVSALQGQLGPDGRRAWELVNGIDRTWLKPIERSQKVVDSLRFPWPAASIDALSFGISTLLDRVFASVRRIGKAAGRMDLTFDMSDGESWVYTHVFKEPTDSAKLAHTVVITYVESQVRGENSPIRNPVETVRVELSRLGQGRAEQSGLWNDHERGDIETALRQLNAKYTSSPIKTVVNVEPWSRIPERRQALAEATNR